MGLFSRQTNAPDAPKPPPPTPLQQAERCLRAAKAGGIYNQVIADALTGLLVLEVERAKREGWK